jgi:hypothetical protein
MTTLTITATQDFTSQTLTNIDKIVFATSGFARATFDASQFGAGKISNTVQITGDTNQNAITVNMASAGTFSAAGWTFVSFNVAPDILDFFGSSGADTITGSLLGDQIRGGNGADSIDGGPSGDTIIVDSNDIVAGETLNGGTGNNALNLSSSNSTTDISLATLINIDFLSFNNRVNATAIVNSSQIGSGGIGTISSTDVSLVQTLVVNGSTVDLSALAFTSSWTGISKTIRMNGTPGIDTFIGSHQNDEYVVDNASDSVTDGAGGGLADRVLASVSYSLPAGAEIEFLSTPDAAGTAAINLTGNELANTIQGNAGPNTLNGRGGDDDIDGGIGIDTAIFSGPSSAYTLTPLAGNGVQVSGPDGTDTLQCGATGFR